LVFIAVEILCVFAPLREKICIHLSIRGKKKEE